MVEDGSNICVDSDAGDAAATEAAFARAAHVVRLDTPVQRVTGVPMEPRAAVGAYDAATGRYTLHAGSGRRRAAEGASSPGVLGVADDAVRVIAGDVGGNFGTRNTFYPEFALVAWAAKRRRPAGQMDLRAQRRVPERLSRPRPAVRGRACARRRRPFPGAARHQHQQSRRHTAISFVPLAKGIELMSSVYRHPGRVFARPRRRDQHAADRAYRSAGRPGGDVRDRAADRPRRARSHGFDRVELRRRNLVPPTAHAVPQPARPHLRQRRLRSRRWTARAGARRLGGFRGAPARSARERGRCAASASPTMSS